MRWADGDGFLAVTDRKLDIYNARKSSFKCYARVVQETQSIAVDYVLNVIGRNFKFI